jgi:hypothetical protein
MFLGHLASTRSGEPGDDLRVHVLKSVGKPDAVVPHVRFDERGRETGDRHRLPHCARPRLYHISSGVDSECAISRTAEKTSAENTSNEVLINRMYLGISR